ncbi:hypothetical protein J7T55_007850 [Diaporthe amygdali]|uniref:uncharacterized protein n=1 Tax=Phomopsis amygdali TaxID=1214568 RepID=UPI0022FEAB00|nr:uncharacterized protein J7T55_007850 [Diaporthe amygdali]KAJ0114016.1 hypothetical protein J7T55_007850 [Diaporthe amygdali]
MEAITPPHPAASAPALISSHGAPPSGAPRDAVETRDQDLDQAQKRDQDPDQAPDSSNVEVGMADEDPSAPSLLSPGIKVEFHGSAPTLPPSQPTDDGRGEGDGHARPSMAPHPRSAPAVQQYQSPMRHHKRTPSQHRVIKETLNARSEYTSDDSDGRSHHVINQYTIKEEIGRGSYGAVHLGVDQFGNEYAIKEFSKTRLRKRAQSNILRRGPRRGPGRFPPRPRTAADSGSGPGMDPTVSYQLRDHKKNEDNDSLFLIREEIAIMKKLNHPNLVSLIEVLDDPDEDSLYMVLEMCKKGVVMKVGLDEAAEPYSEETCRYWFRDLILGIEYLHAQGVVHRDIKPDNLLLTEDDVLKIVDFGVSEMFEKPEQMRTAKSAGSPAFLPPELCVAKHGDVSGTAADVWSMGVSLFCLRYGHIPFNRSGVLEIYEAIKTETPAMPEDENEHFKNLISRLMEKDPEQRITMPEIREHPWVTKDGTDPLLSSEENCSELVEAPNELEVSHAFTRRMGHLLCVMKAISNFKSLLSSRSRTNSPRTSLFPEDADPNNSGHVPRWTRHRPKPSMDDQEYEALKRANEEHAARLLEQRKQFLLSRTGNTAPVHTDDAPSADQAPTEEESGRSHGERHPEAMASAPALLGIGTGGRDNFAGGSEDEPASVADSPTAVDFNVYDRAYEEEIERIKKAGSQPSVYMTWHLNSKDQFHKDGALDVKEEHGDSEAGGGATAGERGREKAKGVFKANKFADLVSQTIRDTRARSQDGGGNKPAGDGGDEES